MRASLLASYARRNGAGLAVMRFGGLFEQCKSSHSERSRAFLYLPARTTVSHAAPRARLGRSGRDSPASSTTYARRDEGRSAGSSSRRKFKEDALIWAKETSRTQTRPMTWQPIARLLDKSQCAFVGGFDDAALAVAALCRIAERPQRVQGAAVRGLHRRVPVATRRLPNDARLNNKNVARPGHGGKWGVNAHWQSRARPCGATSTRRPIRSWRGRFELERAAGGRRPPHARGVSGSKTTTAAREHEAPARRRGEERRRKTRHSCARIQASGLTRARTRRGPCWNMSIFSVVWDLAAMARRGPSACTYQDLRGPRAERRRRAPRSSPRLGAASSKAGDVAPSAGALGSRSGQSRRRRSRAQTRCDRSPASTRSRAAPPTCAPLI